MKTRILQILSLVLLMVLVLVSCGTPSGNTEDTTTPTTTSDDSVKETTEDEIYIPREDKEVKYILMLGNSFCYYFTEELYGIAKADGHDLVIANLYKSGCSVEEHWRWLNDNSPSYELRVVSAKYGGRVKQVKPNTIAMALAYAKDEFGTDWDVITLQQHFGPNRATDYEFGYKETSSYAKKLFDRIGAEHPVFIGQGHHHRLRQLHGLDGVDTFRHRQIHQPRTGAQSPHGRQRRRPREAPTAAQQQDSAIISFMRVRLPVRQD